MPSPDSLVAGEPFPIDLGDPALRAALLKSLRQRVPAADVEDIVQATLIEALASKHRPGDAESARRWLWGIARHKVADLHRRGRREVTDEGTDEGAAPDEAPHDASDLMRWAEEQLPDGEDVPQTFEWLLREGDGDKLEHIADEADIPAPRVRQRVSRLRKHLRSRWALEVAAVAALVGVALLLWWRFGRHPQTPDEDRIVREIPSAAPPVPSPFEQARELRRAALPRCEANDREACLRGLDEAKRLDPAGDAAPEVQAARQRVEPPPPPPSASTTTPTRAPVPTPAVPPTDGKDGRQAPRPPGTTPAPDFSATPSPDLSDRGSGNTKTEPIRRPRKTDDVGSVGKK